MVERSAIAAMRARRAELQGIGSGTRKECPLRSCCQPCSVFNRSRQSLFRSLLGHFGGASTDALKPWSPGWLGGARSSCPSPCTSLGREYLGYWLPIECRFRTGDLHPISSRPCWAYAVNRSCRPPFPTKQVNRGNAGYRGRSP